MKSLRPILLIEDDKVDSMTMLRALEEVHVSNDVVIKENGEEAISWLLETETLPCIILLDLNMPRMSGTEFLKERKKHDNLLSIPAIVFTTSAELQDKEDTFRLCISGYMKKPVDYKQFVELIRTINLYWTLSELPND
jgi:CheY-like chemotaxis protein